ncbi:GPW/gp25 family protein [Streptomyces chrestomyceticus]|uniref:GPW/gp25 family protein n=1 Tax=Streptomyces chrestomyceticus TaxID=68185 RepID=UPI0019D268EC|nr:GPW/gp25 family protein [Streptomyces chrestomyceticus]
MDKLIGAGWGFPGVLDVRGGVALVRREEEIEQAIRLVLRTVPGERPMRPDFGCGAYALVFGPLDGATAGRIAYDVRTSLERWEPRIEVLSVDVGRDASAHPASDADHTLYVDLSYRLNATGQTRALVAPFYVIPPHPRQPGPTETASSLSTGP